MSVLVSAGTLEFCVFKGSLLKMLDFIPHILLLCIDHICAHLLILIKTRPPVLPEAVNYLFFEQNCKFRLNEVVTI